MQSIVVWAGIIGSVFGAITSAVGLIALYRSSVRKSYAAERDFNHLKNDYKNLAANVEFMAKEIDKDFASLTKDLDTRCDRIDQNLIELKSLAMSDLAFKKQSRNEFE